VVPILAVRQDLETIRTLCRKPRNVPLRDDIAIRHAMTGKNDAAAGSMPLTGS